jgi:hypothetical protein
MNKDVRSDLNNLVIIHNLDFSWGNSIEGKMYGQEFKVSVDNEGCPFDVKTEYEDQERLLALLNFMGLTWYQVN